MAELETRQLEALSDNYVCCCATPRPLQSPRSVGVAMSAMGGPVPTFAEIHRRQDAF